MAFERGLTLMVITGLVLTCPWAGARDFVIRDRIATQVVVAGSVAKATFQVQNPNDDSIVIQAVTPGDAHCSSSFTEGPIDQNQIGKIVFSCPVFDEGAFVRQADVYLFSARSQTTTVEQITIEGEATIDCGVEINLAAPGGSMEKIVAAMPFILQEGGTCSFQSAAQLFDAMRNRDDPTATLPFSSPLELDYQVKVKEGGKIFSAGDTKKNLLLIQETGVCPRPFFDPKTGRDADEGFYSQLFSAFLNLIKNERTSEPASSVAQSLISSLKLKSLFMINAHPNEAKLDSAIRSKNFIKFVQELVPPECSKEKRIYSPHPFQVVDHEYSFSVFGYHNHDSAPVRSEITNELNKGIKRALPIVISYCSEVLFRGMSYDKVPNEKDPSCGSHASIVMGQRRGPKSGRCEYLVRNTWGRVDCYGNHDWECIPETGMVWVDSKTLSHAVYETTRIED